MSKLTRCPEMPDLKFILLQDCIDLKYDLFDQLDYIEQIKIYLEYNPLDIEYFNKLTYFTFREHIKRTWEVDKYYTAPEKIKIITRNLQRQYFYIIVSIYLKNPQYYQSKYRKNKSRTVLQ